MRQRHTWLLLPLVAVWISTLSYEDLTHQKLTDQAIKVAENNGLPRGFFTDPEKQAIINGAGKGPEARGAWRPSDSDGEDYTKYKINWECPVTVTPSVWRIEPFHHFWDRILWASPAHVKFDEFFADAVTLWKKGKKTEATFILGRAVHLVEDMAAPQHATDEMHYSGRLFWWARHPSFLENFTEANLKESGAFCTNSSTDYKTLIEGINPQPLPVLDSANPQNAVMIMASSTRKQTHDNITG